MKKIESALISVYHKEGLEPIVSLLKELQVKIYSTGGTYKFLQGLEVEVQAVESLTGYPSILGGRVKTLHPKVFGGILYRSEEAQDQQELAQYEIPTFDLVIVDLYPFEATLAQGASETEIIEKIDIGGIALIRAAAKNYKDVAIVASQQQYEQLQRFVTEGQGSLSLENRKRLATQAFEVTSHYDTAIYGYFSKQTGQKDSFKESIRQAKPLRYGENPHQEGIFFGNLEEILEQLHGKELSYNNLVDIDAAVSLMEEFEETAFAILKHTNACGMAVAESPKEAYLKALAGDPISAFGGVIISNRPIDEESAEELHKLFFEVLIAPNYEEKALSILKQKKNRILLKQIAPLKTTQQYKTVLNGVVLQDRDIKMETKEDLTTVTKRAPSEEEIAAMLFANRLVKHTKSNTIVLASKNQLLASGVGQTSRVDALKQAILKANTFGFDLKGAVMASDAFFPFPDCVEIAHQAGITAVIQPGGSVRDQESIDYCDRHQLAMVTTGIRHFKH